MSLGENDVFLTQNQEPRGFTEVAGRNSSSAKARDCEIVKVYLAAQRRHSGGTAVA